MSTHCLVGTINADDPATIRVRHVHFDGHPTNILPTLDRIWSTTCAHDATALLEALLAHEWSYLDADVTADTSVTFAGERPVPGVGVASEFDVGSTVEALPVDGPVDHVRWVYVIDPAQSTIAVYEAAELTTPLNVHCLTGPPAPAALLRAELLAAARSVGATVGQHLADTWAQDTLNGRAPAQARETAWRMLTGDPAIARTLPQPDLSAPGDTPPAELAGLVEEPNWSTLTPAHRTKVLDAWRTAARTALAGRVAEHCLHVLNPTDGAGRDLSHLHPDRLRIGRVGVFAGDWSCTEGPSGQIRIPMGYAGTLIDRWNGWAVFTCTRTVAEAIVAEQQAQRDRLQADLIDRGRSPDDAAREVDDAMGTMRFNGDTIVVDETAVYGDPSAVTRIEPDRDGRYVVMGGSWCWQAVDPHDCDRIVGDLPAPGQEQQFVELPHSGMWVPHDRLRVTHLQKFPGTPAASLATLALDDKPVAEARTSADGSAITRLSAAFGRNDWTGYVAGCRRYGVPVSETHILDALVTEHQIGQAARQAEADGGVLTRLLDADGTILRLRPVWPAPRDYTARRQLGQRLRQLAPHPQGRLWQWWTGAGWHHLASITGSGAIADPAQRQPNVGQLLAHIIAEALYERLDRDHMVHLAAGEGIPLDPRMSDEQIRDLLRAAHRESGREAGLPVDDLPTLSAAEGLELGRLAASGADADRPAPTGQQEPSEHGDHATDPPSQQENRDGR
ncbi:hypothetical protein [Phytohabitans aurantiacus]|uniref:Uncharacterized protein n=1 Tax=Phytohabitans aurantiacus TaxID=3016789 RepID=A0ABQ5RDN7_9ACTN|nr:hypothetical protein [Phytohabitans aurantiacus]GLI03711.1 hypothetical protein Pa4123_89900 [Phytohabitans aurantiacus]